MGGGGGGAAGGHGGGDGGADAGAPVGCSSPLDAGTGGAAAGFPFPHVVAGTGPLITAPDVVTVTFPGDTLASQLTSFGASATNSCYWDVVRANYCIGSACVGDGVGTPAPQTTAPGASYTDSAVGGASTLQTYLQGLITAGSLPTPTANTLYALYFPSTTTITLDGAASCTDFYGYHNGFMMGSTLVAFAVIPECTPPQGLTLLQNTTDTASHEAIEAATDTGDGFYLDVQNDPKTWGWNDIQGGEVADFCVDPFGLGLDEWTENGFTVQRIWSLTQAAAGKNPCVPIPAGEVYFNTYTSDQVLVMDVGTSKTITVTAAADGTMPAWTVLPQDWTDPTGQTSYLSFSIAGGTNTDAGSQIQMTSGQTINLTVTLTADPTSSANGEADGVLVSANGTSAATVTAAHFWPFIVLTTATAQDAGVTMQRHPRVRKNSHMRGLHRGLFQ